MIKRMIVAAVMMFVLSSAVTVSHAELPWPECLPCPDDPPNR